MTREEKLWTMTNANLKVIAEKLNIKVKSKDTKEQIIKAVLAAEEVAGEQNTVQQMPAKKKTVPPTRSEQPAKKIKTEEPKKKSVGKPAKLLEYKGKSQGICAWAKEYGINENTLWARVYRMGWSLEKALETK